LQHKGAKINERHYSAGRHLDRGGRHHDAVPEAAARKKANEIKPSYQLSAISYQRVSHHVVATAFPGCQNDSCNQWCQAESRKG
jgi:hypothetical protein